MPTYLQLRQEPVWLEQITPPNMTTFLLDPLRAHYNMDARSIGAMGDNNHLYGRHRSRDWCLTSRYCTNRSYGTKDARDKGGLGDWYRASDVGIQGQALYDASHRMDDLTRSGRCPGIAEWFGTFDGETVVGWYEGHPSSSDDSHLWHLHVGLWTESANDQATMQMIYAAITGEGEDDMTPEEHALLDDMAWRMDAIYANAPELRGGTYANDPELKVNQLHAKLAELEAKIEAIKVGDVAVVITKAQIAEVVREELDKTKLTG